MSTIWPFFNHSFSSANINKILNEIEQDNIKRNAAAQLASTAINSSPISVSNNNSPKPTIAKTSQHTTALVTNTTATSTPISLPTSLLNNHNNVHNNNNSNNTSNSSPLDIVNTTASLSPEVAYSPTTTQFNITASQLLQSIQNNSPSPSPSPLAKITNGSTDQGIPITSTNQSIQKNLASTIISPLANSSQSSIRSVPRNNSFSQIPTLQFSKSNINVRLFNKLLDQPNLLDEINLSKNQKLINYLSQKDVVTTMFEYILFSMKLSKYSTVSELPNGYLSHDIFTSGDDNKLDKQSNDYTDDSLENNFLTNDNELSNNTNGNDDVTVNHLDNDNENEYENENEDTNIDKLQNALQRATVISEIMILPASNIHQTLLTDFDIFAKLWRGFMNSNPKFYFKDTELLVPTNISTSAETQQMNGNDIDNADSVYSEEITIGTTDVQKLSELEESNNYLALRDSHEIVMFNNFLKFVDDLALINISGFMNFIRFEQEYYQLTEQFIKFIPYSQTVCDLLVRLISTDKPYNSNGLINILLDQNLILKLLKICKKYYLDHQVQDNVCNLLNGIVGISSNIGFWEDNVAANNGSQDDQQDMSSNNPNIGPNDLTRQLVSEECMVEMLDIILNHGNYGLVTIVSVIIEVIRKNNSDYDEFDWISSVSVSDDNKCMPNPRDPIYLGNLLKLFSLKLDQIVKTYLTDYYYEFKNISKLNSSIGHEIEPLGYERFKIMELIAELLHCSNMILMNKSIELDKLINKRDSLRDIKKTEQLMTDAINGLIINQENDLTQNGLNNFDKLSTGSNSSTHTTNTTNISSKNNLGSSYEYIAIPLNLSVGNFFKYQLLKTHSIPLISLKLIKFPWNNFMHNVIFDLIQQIFNGRLANWDEDRAINQEETIFDDNLSLNKILIWSLFGEYADFGVDCKLPEGDNEIYCKEYDNKNDEYPGYFNLALFIVHCFKVSNDMYSRTNFRFGYMGHLTLIAEEIHKFQSYVENFGATKNENAFGLHKEEEDAIRPFYLKSSYFIFNELYESIFENKGNFKQWLDFVNSDLREISSMYNKVLGNPNEIDEGQNTFEQEKNMLPESGVDNFSEPLHLGLSNEQALANMNIQDAPKAQGAIILDNGDSEEFRKGIDQSDTDSLRLEEEEKE